MGKGVLRSGQRPGTAPGGGLGAAAPNLENKLVFRDGNLSSDRDGRDNS
jgi:hypothetical protein